MTAVMSQQVTSDTPVAIIVKATDGRGRVFGANAIRDVFGQTYREAVEILTRAEKNGSAFLGNFPNHLAVSKAEAVKRDAQRCGVEFGLLLKPPRRHCQH